MFPLSLLTYIKIGAIVSLVVGIYFAGWSKGHSSYVEYKASVEAAVKTQEAQIESLKKQQELVTKAKDEEYTKSLALIRAYYANGVRNNGSSPMQSLSLTSSIADAAAKYNLLASDCAATTAQLIDLQGWVNEQLGLK